MRLPFFWASLGISIGILMEPFLPVPPVWIWGGLLFMLPLLWATRGSRVFLPIFILLLIFAGVLHARNDRTKSPDAVEFFAAPGRVSLQGIVRTQPEVQIQGRKKKVSFVLASENLMRWTNRRREFLKVNGNVQVLLLQPEVIPTFGDRVRLSGSLEKPPLVLNPGQFDYGRYLAESNIHSIFKGIGRKSLRILRTDQAPLILRSLFSLRRVIANRIDVLFSEKDAIFFKALIVGERKNISPELRDEFMKTGTSHLWAISGMNIALVVGTIYVAMIALGIPQKMAAAIGMIIVTSYVLIAGFGIPVQRAGWMAGAGFLGLVAEREKNSLNAFFLAFLMLILILPRSLGNVSFQLSFLSVLVLILILQQMPTKIRWLDCIFQSFVVVAGTFPVALYYFNVFAPISVVANLAAIPLFDVALLLALLSLPFSFIPFLGFVITHSAAFFLQTGLLWIHLCSIPRWGYWFVTTPSIPHLIFYYFVFGILLSVKFLKFSIPKWASAVAMSFWMLTASSFFWRVSPDEFSLTLFAAGKNELAYVQFDSRHQWLVNVGRHFPSDQGQWIVAPFLKEKGIKHLSGVILTDFYKKHTGGLATLRRNFSWDSLSNPDVMHPGDQIAMKEGKEIRVLASQNGQMVLGIKQQSWKFLYLPSIHSPLLEGLEAQRDFLEGVRVIVLPAFSRPPSEAELLKLLNLVDPEIVILSHAGAEADHFFKEMDMQVFDIENHGAITFSIPKYKDAADQIPLLIYSMLRGRIAELI